MKKRKCAQAAGFFIAENSALAAMLHRDES